MLDMHSDPTALIAAYGCHIAQTELDDLVHLYRGITEIKIRSKTAEILAIFDTPDPGRIRSHGNWPTRTLMPGRALPPV